MSKETLLLLGAIISSPFIGILIKSFFEKGKTGAETHNLNISGEISIGDAWAKYAEKIGEDFKNLNARFDALNAKFEVLKKEKELLAVETELKDKKIKQLEARILVLEQEIETYKHNL